MDDDDFVKWDDKYSVGIQLIDDQHKELISLTNALFRGCLAGPEEAKAYFSETIQGAVDYVKYHFSAEEKILEEIKFPGYENHKSQHKSFIVKILTDVRSFEEGKKFVPNAFVRYLRDWILSHIAVMDKQYADYMQQNNITLGHINPGILAKSGGA
ncbi:MAG: bacteriohemerythrin [Treponema sp.]|jgi:hemerythrin|nr:bacteriohemerythrin [Treponema sp.]